jgi:hypothetical protein
MPIRAYLDREKFDFETTWVMGLAFEMARLRSSEGALPTDEAIAKRIIELTRAGERDSVIGP